MKELRLFVEGGSKIDASRSGKLREGMSRFFRQLSQHCRSHGVEFHLRLCWGIEQTFEIFRKEYEKDHHRALCVLLVDADRGVQSGHSPCSHLRELHRTWRFPTEQAPHYQLMVQATEAWLLADRAAAQGYFGCRAEAIPEGDVESWTKKQLEAILHEVCGARGRKHDKLEDNAALLKRVNPDVVRQAAPHCDRLFIEIMKVIPPPGFSPSKR